jgi:hypothetical protein
MRNYTLTLCLVVAACSVAGSVRSALAQQQQSKDLVPWKGTATGTSSAFVIPVDPPIAVVQFTATGESSALGTATTVGYFLMRIGADGTPMAVTDGIYVETAANGDAIYGTFSGLVRPSEKPGHIALEAISLISGGKGRFAGASGHDLLRAETELATGKGSFSWEGLISRPKP